MLCLVLREAVPVGHGPEVLRVALDGRDRFRVDRPGYGRLHCLLERREVSPAEGLPLLQLRPLAKLCLNEGDPFGVGTEPIGEASEQALPQLVPLLEGSNPHASDRRRAGGLRRGGHIGRAWPYESVRTVKCNDPDVRRGTERFSVWVLLAYWEKRESEGVVFSRESTLTYVHSRTMHIFLIRNTHFERSHFALVDRHRGRRWCGRRFCGGSPVAARSSGPLLLSSCAACCVDAARSCACKPLMCRKKERKQTTQALMCVASQILRRFISHLLKSTLPVTIAGHFWEGSGS